MALGEIVSSIGVETDAVHKIPHVMAASLDPSVRAQALNIGRHKIHDLAAATEGELKLLKTSRENWQNALARIEELLAQMLKK